MEKSEIQDKVLGEVAEVLGEPRGNIGLDYDLSDDLGADSLDLVEIIMGLEETFPVTLHDLDWASTGKVTVEQVTKDICRLLGAPTVQVAT